LGFVDALLETTGRDATVKFETTNRGEDGGTFSFLTLTTIIELAFDFRVYQTTAAIQRANAVETVSRILSLVPWF
jgi:hypothetical protein